MLHLLYILAFTVLAFVAVGNLIRSLVTVGMSPSALNNSDQIIAPYRILALNLYRIQNF